MSHRRTSSFNFHFDHGSIVLKTVQLRLTLKRMCGHGYIIHIKLSPSFDMLSLGFGIENCPSFLVTCMFGCWLNVTPQSPCPNDQEQVTHPYVIQHPEKWSQTLWNCARQKFVSCTSNLLGQMFCFPEIHKTPPEVDFESSRSPAKSESWNKPSLQCRAVFPTWQYCRKSFVWWMKEISLAKRSVTCLSPCVCASLLIWPLGCQVVQFVPSTSILRQFVSKLSDNSPTDSSSSCLNWWSSRQGLENFVVQLLHFLVCQFAVSLNAFLSMSLQCRSTTLLFVREFFSHSGNFSVAPARNSWLKHLRILFNWMISFGLHSRWVHPTEHMDQEMMWVRQSPTFFINFFHMGAIFCFFPAILMSSTYTDRNNLLFPMNEHTFPIRNFSSHPNSDKASSNCLSHSNPANGWPYKFRSRGTHGIFNFSHDFGHLCRGRRIQTSGFRFGEFWAIWEQSSNKTWVCADTASAACPSQPGNLATTSVFYFCSSHLWRRRACSVKTA